MKPVFYEAYTPAFIARCLEVRREVFTIGQGVPEHLDKDGKDLECIHFLGVLGNTAIATLRMQQLNRRVKIQRVAVREEYRKIGAGRGIMEAAQRWAEDNRLLEVILGAQVTVIGFYEKLGFIPYGKRYMETGIEHQNMKLVLFDG